MPRHQGKNVINNIQEYMLLPEPSYPIIAVFEYFNTAEA